MRSKFFHIVWAISALYLVGCEGMDPVAPSSNGENPTHPSAPHFTMGSGTSSVFHGLGTHEAFKVKRMNVGLSDHWMVDIHAKPGLSVAAQTITFFPDGQSGWHRHPGPVLIQVVEGTMTFYESNDPDCAPIVRTAGQAYLDVGEHAHIARNESDANATNLVVYFAPPGTTQQGLRIDAPDPGHCSFSP